MNKSISELNLLVETLRQIRTSKDYDTRSWYKTIVKLPQIINFKYGKFEDGSNKGRLFCMHLTIYGKRTGVFKRLSIDTGKVF